MSKRQQHSKTIFLGSKQGLIFLVFAAVLWLLSALSETYTAVVPVRVELESDNDKFLLLSPQIEVPIRVSGTGFSLAYRKIAPYKIQLSTSDFPNLDIDSPDVGRATFFALFQKNLANANNLLAVNTDVVRLPITSTAQKSLLPVLNAPPSLAEGYQLTSPLQLSVDSVSVFGSKFALDNIEEATFIIEKHKDLTSDVILQAKLLDSLTSFGKWSTTSIEVSAKVDRYSDVSFDLPVVVKDVPDSSTLAIRPKKVTIKFAAPLSELRSFDASSLRVEATFIANTSGELPVRVYGLSESTKQLVVDPEVVQYFIVE